MGLSNREQTQEQFSPGTTADGNRLDRAMRDIVSFWNAIPKRNRAKRYVQTQLVGGFNMGGGENRQLPFMSAYNSDFFYNSDDKRNEWRYKGTRNPYIDPEMIPVPFDRIVVWGPKIAMPKGAILDGIAVSLDYDGRAVAPNCATVDGDMTVLVDVDDRWTPDIRRQSLLQYLFNRLDMRAFWSMNDALPAPAYANTMLPPHYPSVVRAFNGFWGFALEERGLGIALPELSRVRLGIVIPRYNFAGAHGWSVRPWADANWSWTLTFLEEVQ